MTYEAFKNFVVDTLGEKIDVSGATLYSSFLTLRPGRLLIMGLNPGGSESVSIRDSMDLLKADPNYNEYEKNWGTKHPLQENIKAIVTQFGLRVKDVCGTNLIFARSSNEAGAGFASRYIYWPIHQLIIGIVKPEVIIAFGNGSISPYRHLLDVASDIRNVVAIDAGHGKYKCRAFTGTISKVRMTVIGLPHLSRYHLYVDNPVKKDVLRWMARIGARENS